MRLHFQEYRSDRAHAPRLIILHGLLGSSDNWHSLARRWSKEFYVYSLDARNHGRSPQSDEFNYDVMVEDLRQFMVAHHLNSVYLLGHSMGGKTAMQISFKYPELVAKLVVVDIAPKSYEAHHEHIFEALFSLDLQKYSNRKEVEHALMEPIPSHSTRQFLLKNLRRKNDGKYGWKMNLDVINRHYDEMNQSVEGIFPKPTLFIRGQKSDYILDSDIPQIRSLFPLAFVKTIAGAGHWVHADAPAAFADLVSEFLSSSGGRTK